MTYPTYEKYKESGVPWLGDVPEGWEVKKLRYAAKLSDKRVPYEEADCSYVGLEHIESWTGKRINDDEASADGIVSMFEAGDVLFGTLRPYLAKVHRAEQKGCSSTEALVLRGSEALDTHFLKYYMLSPAFIDEVNAATYGAKMPRANWTDVGGLPVSLPNPTEQKAIAEFLDTKTAEIDALVAKKQELLKLLAEQRTALITHAVTKGLNPSAPMKDSGIDWLGHIPQHWKTAPLKFCLRFMNNRRIPLSGEYRGRMADKIYPYYGASGIIDQVEDYIFDEPSILIAEDGANLLSRSTPLAFIAEGKYWVNNHAHILKTILGSFDYWANLLCNVDYTPWITGSAQPKLNKENLGGIHLPLPPEDEQYEIAEHLMTVTQKIDPISEKTQEAIDRLKEYRTALITNAVTGKIKVV